MSIYCMESYLATKGVFLSTYTLYEKLLVQGIKISLVVKLPGATWTVHKLEISLES